MFEAATTCVCLPVANTLLIHVSEYEEGTRILKPVELAFYTEFCLSEKFMLGVGAPSRCGLFPCI